jgi:pimeloyl-ACP methyl ester carboxylesterase
MTEGIVHANGIDLCVETFGDALDPAVLLIMGAAGSLIRWEEAFCTELASPGRHVIRFDNRDTGRSTTMKAADYTLVDLAADALGLLDGLAIARAHVVGISMGGMVAQLLALAHPDRVTGLTLIATTCDPFAAVRAAAGQARQGDLPGPSPAFVAALTAQAANPAGLPYAQHQAELYRLLSGSGRDYDATVQHQLAERERARATDLASSYHHEHAITATPPWHEELPRITVPTTVVHGTEDPMMGIAHAQALAKHIPGAELVLLEGAGHELHHEDWTTVISAITE